MEYGVRMYVHMMAPLEQGQNTRIVQSSHTVAAE